jgi:hypothetical protein
MKIEAEKGSRAFKIVSRRRSIVSNRENDWTEIKARGV